MDNEKTVNNDISEEMAVNIVKEFTSNTMYMLLSTVQANMVRGYSFPYIRQIDEHGKVMFFFSTLEYAKEFIEENDLQIKLKKVFEFLADGDKVKISVMTKGRKRVLAQGRDAIPELFAHIMEIIGDAGTLESKSKPDERTKSIIVAPAKPNNK